MFGPVDRDTEIRGEQPRLWPGSVGDYQIVDGRRVYHKGSPNPFPQAPPYFALDAYQLRHRLDDPNSPAKRMEVFERGNSVGVLLFNRDSGRVIVVKQFRLPTLVPNVTDGMLVETIAGEVKDGKDARQVAIDRTKAETGYDIKDPEPIAEFFSSPGGTSERIFLYYAEVGNADKKEQSAAQKAKERIEVVEYSIEDLTKLLRKQEILDPKLLIAAYHLQARLGLRLDTDDAHANGTDQVEIVRLTEPRVKIGIKTGDVLAVHGVDIWLNPENRYMMMSRFIDKGLSASIRWGGAEKHRSLKVATDTIGNALRVEMGGRAAAEENEIIETQPGGLRKLGVKRLLHLPIAEAAGEVRALEGLSVNLERIRPILKAALRYAHDGEHGAKRFLSILRGRPRCKSVLIPLIGSGEGRITPHHCVPEILRAIEEFLIEHPETCIKEFYLLAFWKREVEVCRAELKVFAEKNKWSLQAGRPPGP